MFERLRENLNEEESLLRKREFSYGILKVETNLFKDVLGR